jgi:hypothetical protein
MRASDVVDTLLEIPVVTSFTRLGHDIRSRVEHWAPVATRDMTDRVVF